MRHISLLVLLFIPFISNAQYSENLQSDRPGQSLSPNTVGKRVLQIQAGYVHDNSQYTGTTRGFIEGQTWTNKQDYGNLKLRYGIFERTEFSIQTSLGKGESKVSVADGRNFESDIADFGFGIRQNFLNEDEHFLSLGSEAEFYMYADDSTDPEIRFTVSASKAFFEKLSLTVNLGYIFLNESIITANAAYRITNDLGVFVEYFPKFGEDNMTNSSDYKLLKSSVNTGLYYQLSPNFMIDVAGFFQTYDIRESENVETSGFSFQIGLTSRLDWRK